MDEFYRSRFPVPPAGFVFAVRFAVRGSRFAVRGSVRGSRFAVRGSWFVVRGSAEPVARTAYNEAQAAVADCVQFLTSQSTYAHFTSA